MNIFFQEVRYRRNFLLLFFSLLIFLFSPLELFADVRIIPFTVGETLDPGAAAQPCGPIDANCFPSLNLLPPIGTTNGSTGIMAYQELLANGTNTVAFRAPDSVASNIIWTLPGVDGLNNQVLTTNGAGLFAWTSVVGGGSAAGGIGAIQFSNGVTFAGDSSTFFWDNTLKNLAVGTSSAPARLSLQGAYGSQEKLIDIASSTNANASATSSLFNILANGNVGIATTSPYAKLSVAGEVVAAYFTATTTSATSTFAGAITTNLLQVTGTSASSSFANGINISAGCFAQNGICLSSGGGGSSSAVGGTGAVQFANGAAFNGDNTQLSFVGGNLGIGTSSALAKLDIMGVNTEAVQGPELITAAFDRDFSSAGNWTGVNWAVGGGVATHVAGANPFTLASINLTELPVAGRAYLVTFTLDTTVASWLQISIGGQMSPAFGDHLGVETESVLITALDASPLVLSPSGSWVGTFSNVSVTKITPVLAAQILRNADGTIGLELRTGGSGLNNTFIGKDSGMYNTTGISNVAVGSGALRANTSGFSNVAIGLSALAANTEGGENIALGYDVLTNNTTGSDNLAFGNGALSFNTTGGYNIANGFSALGLNTTGSSNIALGSNALVYNTTGSENIASGHNALSANTTGSYNIANGYGALYSNSIGSDNIALGNQALLFTIGSSSTAVGALAGFNNVDGNNNLFLGDEADVSLASSFSNATAIGSHAKVGASNTLVLGGNGAFAVNVGIGTTTPYARLSVAGQGVFQSLVATGTGATNQSTFQNITFVNATGTNATTTNLYSSGRVTSLGTLTVGTSTVLAQTGTQGLYGSTRPLFDVASSTNANGSATTSLFRVNANGSVGIGTSSPWRTLSVQGTVALSGLTTLGSTGDALCIVAGGQIEQNTGATSCLVSSRRFKDHINYTDTAAALATVMMLRPASYHYIGSDESRLGLIAEDVEQIESRLVAHNASGTPQTVRYEELASVLAGSIQAVNDHLGNLEGFTIATTSVAANGTPTLLGEFMVRVKTVLGDAGNGIEKIVAQTFVAKEIHTERLCVGTPGDETCITKTQLDQLLQNSGMRSTPAAFPIAPTPPLSYPLRP